MKEKVVFHNYCFNDYSKKTIFKSRLPYSMEELRLQAYCHNFKIENETDKKFILVPPFTEEIEDKNIAPFSYGINGNTYRGRRVKSGGEEWDDDFLFNHNNTL